jgi:ubiquinone/menaquinone biosynthesis C-methylase UbiE
MPLNKYLMESEDEALRLELKTDVELVKKQAKWAGIKPGMRIADIGCGPGITTSALHSLSQPDGQTIGVDFSKPRIEYARKHYNTKGIEHVLKDIRNPLDDLGLFDFVWVRFVLEYYLNNSFEIVKNLLKIVKPGGILCLVDLDHNCLSNHGIPERLNNTVNSIMHGLQTKANFDPYIGRKLYSYLYDLHFDQIIVDIYAHHNIYGELSKNDEYNFLKKVEVAPNKINFEFDDYRGGYKEFLKEAETSFKNPRRFTYTPIILCKGVKPKN